MKKKGILAKVNTKCAFGGARGALFKDLPPHHYFAKSLDLRKKLIYLLKKRFSRARTKCAFLLELVLFLVRPDNGYPVIILPLSGWIVRFFSNDKHKSKDTP